MLTIAIFSLMIAIALSAIKVNLLTLLTWVRLNI